MKPALTPLIVGAGGVASYMLPALIRSFDITDGVLMDADILEEHNLDRQLFHKEHIGRNKAEALLLTQGIRERRITHLTEFITEDTQKISVLGVEPIFNVVIALVDNHAARRACLQYAAMAGVPCVIAANEYTTSQALISFPYERGTKADPTIRYPEILTDMSGDPTACQGEEQESSPQLAIANQVAGALANYLIWLWFSEGLPDIRDNLYSNLPIEIQTTFGGAESLTIKSSRKLK